MEQIKSRKRVKELAEVFTNKREVVAMLDLVQEDSYNIYSKFLEPACGNGNFLEEICLRKFSLCRSEEDIVNVFRSIYAVDICPENIEETKNRLFNLFRLNYDKMIPNSILSEDLQIAVMSYLNSNVVRGDFLNDSIFFDMIPLSEIEFDVIIGNPPYQINTGGGKGQGAKPIYHKFIENAIELNPKYISMIVPSRWFSGGRGLCKFRTKFLNDKRLKKIVDFKNEKVCFPSVEIKGGVNYFLWDYNHKDLTEYLDYETLKSVLIDMTEFDILIRDIRGFSILKKIMKETDLFMNSKVSIQTPFGIHSNFNNYQTETFIGAIKLYGNKQNMKDSKGVGFMDSKDIITNYDLISEYKVFIPKAAGSGKDKYILGTPFLGEPNSVCSQTYLIVDTFKNKLESSNLLAYIKTKFFRFLVSLRKNTQDGMRSVYSFVPIQDMSIEWTDEMLYKKYDLTNEEIAYIESKIAVME